MDQLTNTRRSDGVPDPDGELKEVVRIKIRHYRYIYLNHPDPIVFIPLAVVRNSLVRNSLVLSEEELGLEHLDHVTEVVVIPAPPFPIDPEKVRVPLVAFHRL
jgi:hypothetical protein